MHCAPECDFLMTELLLTCSDRCARGGPQAVDLTVSGSSQSLHPWLEHLVSADAEVALGTL